MIEYVLCPCGEKITEEGTMTKEEGENHNCAKGCCGSVYSCKCGIRIVIRYEPPEVE